MLGVVYSLSGCTLRETKLNLLIYNGGAATIVVH